jgi:hypothetical protein
MRLLHWPIAISALLVAVTGCSGATAAAPAPTVTVTVTATPGHSAAKQPGTVPTGKAITADDNDSTGTATAVRFKQPLPSRYPPDRKGYEYAGLEVRRCFDTISAGADLSVGWNAWTLSYRDGTVVEPAESWSADYFSVTLYPRDRPVRAGQCVRGWIPYEVSKGTRPTSASYITEGADPLEWKVR